MSISKMTTRTKTYKNKQQDQKRIYIPIIYDAETNIRSVYMSIDLPQAPLLIELSP